MLQNLKITTNFDAWHKKRRVPFLWINTGRMQWTKSIIKRKTIMQLNIGHNLKISFHSNTMQSKLFSKNISTAIISALVFLYIIDLTKSFFNNIMQFQILLKERVSVMVTVKAHSEKLCSGLTKGLDLGERIPRQKILMTTFHCPASAMVKRPMTLEFKISLSSLVLKQSILKYA